MQLYIMSSCDLHESECYHVTDTTTYVTM